MKLLFNFKGGGFIIYYESFLNWVKIFLLNGLKLGVFYLIGEIGKADAALPYSSIISSFFDGFAVN